MGAKPGSQIQAGVSPKTSGPKGLRWPGKICVWSAAKMEQRSSFCGSHLDAQPFHILVKGSLALSQILGNHRYFHVTISSIERGKFPRVCTFLPRPAQHSIGFPGEDSSARPLAPAPPRIIRGVLPTFQGLGFQSQLCFCLGSLTWHSSPLDLICSDCDLCPAMAWALRGKLTKEYKRKVKRSIPPGTQSARHPTKQSPGEPESGNFNGWGYSELG